MIRVAIAHLVSSFHHHPVSHLALDLFVVETAGEYLCKMMGWH
jgi:hypothetical protein